MRLFCCLMRGKGILGCDIWRVDLTYSFALLASHFLVLVPQKVTKEDDTQPSRPTAPLRCSTKWASIETRPSGLQKTQATAELEQTMAEISYFVSATQRDGMGFISSK